MVALNWNIQLKIPIEFIEPNPKKIGSIDRYRHIKKPYQNPVFV